MDHLLSISLPARAREERPLLTSFPNSSSLTLSIQPFKLTRAFLPQSQHPHAQEIYLDDRMVDRSSPVDCLKLHIQAAPLGKLPVVV